MIRRIITIETKCPARIDFTGGFTDVSPFRDRMKAIHINSAVDLYIQVRIKTRHDNRIFIHSPSEKIRKEFSSFSKLSKDVKYNFIATAMDTFSLRGGINIKIMSEIPTGIGLGSSGAFWVALVAALYLLSAHKKVIRNYGELAAKASDMENAAGFLGGRQDQFASVFGNINHFEFHQATWRVQPITLSKNKIKTLESHLIIAYRGGKRASSEIVTSVLSAYMSNHKNTYNVLKNLNGLAPEIELALRNMNLRLLAQLLDKVRVLQEKLYAGIIDKPNKRVIQRLSHIPGVGSKMLGGGGNGACILVLSAINDVRPLVFSVLKEAQYTIMPVRITSYGLQVKVKYSM